MENLQGVAGFPVVDAAAIFEREEEKEKSKIWSTLPLAGFVELFWRAIFCVFEMKNYRKFSGKFASFWWTEEGKRERKSWWVVGSCEIKGGNQNQLKLLINLINKKKLLQWEIKQKTFYNEKKTSKTKNN